MSAPNEPTGYDRLRFDTFRTVPEAAEALGLPLNRMRKLRAIANALGMQIEDGGDDTGVNEMLISALRLAAIHQVGQAAAAPLFRAIEAFELAEADRGERIRRGLAPLRSPLDDMEQLAASGDEHVRRRDFRRGCDDHLAAWEIVKRLVSPETLTSDAFNKVHDLGYFLQNWARELLSAFEQIGGRDAVYAARRVQFAREYLACFPDDDVDMRIEIATHEGEALRDLGQTIEAEKLLAALVLQYPDHAMAYAGWANLYEFAPVELQDLRRAHRIFTRALDRPKLDDRRFVLERLDGLQERMAEPTSAAGAGPRFDPKSLPTHSAGGADTRAPARRPGRNAPCWCGSGKKYKLCHLRTDR